jgi:subtilisin family serine protease
MVGFSIPALASEVIKPNYVEGEILVKYKNNDINLKTEAGELKAMRVATFNSLELKENITESNLSLLKITDDKTVEQKITEVESDPNVLYAEPNYLRYPSTINTDDTYKDLLWGLDNTGQSANGELGTTDADMDAPEAWAINEGTNASIIVAVLDTGIAYNHPDLQANMWDGTNCKSDTGAFLGSCIHGYDFLDNDKDPVPAGTYYTSHGTHVAGIIAAVKNNGKGIIGVAPNAKLMALRFNYTIASEVKAINFARQNGAKIINASFGGGYSQSEFDVINLFRQSGGILVAAASNDSSNNDSYPYYPANYDLDNIISVAATDQNDNLASFSNYGLTTVDVGAPGVNIYSTISDSTGGLQELYAYNSGTSMATPEVAGLAALIWGTKQSLTAAGIKDIILTTGDSIPSLNNKTVSGKRINAFNALSNLSSTAVNVTYSDIDKIVKAGDTIVISANFNEPIQDSPIPKISITGSNTLEVTPMIKVSNILYTYTYIVGPGDGISSVLIYDAKTLEGFAIVSIPASGGTFTIDNTAPTFTLSSPNSILTKNHPVYYTATYTGASSINLSLANITLNTTGTATGTITVSGLSNTSRTITISNITGDGTLGISIKADTATDIAQNKALAFGPSETFTVDNTAPSNQDIVFSKSVIKKGDAPVDIVSSEDINNSIWFSPNGTSEFIESTVRTKAVDGTSLSILAPQREGVYNLYIVDSLGNMSPPSIATLTVDNTAPSKPTISSIATDNAISYEERNAIHVIGTAEANSHVTATLSDGTNTKTGTQQLINDGINYDITIDGTTATPASLLNGTIIVSVKATDVALNTSPSSTLNVIQSPQVIVVSSGGGGYTPPPAVIVVNPEIIIPEVTIDLGCKINSLFSITTGKKCSTIATVETVIPGCNGNSLFSPISGKSCGILNTIQTSATNSNSQTTINITRTLKQGSNNNDVKELQKYLNLKGYFVSILGPGSIGQETTLFGPATKKAVILFQKTNKLDADGIVGKMTVKVMNNQ